MTQREILSVRVMFRDTGSWEYGVPHIPVADRIALMRALAPGTGLVVVSANETCPFDFSDNGGLAPEDLCPVCGDSGVTFNFASSCVSAGPK